MVLGGKEMRYLIDIGSSTVKLYEESNKMTDLKFSKTFDFKDGFNPLVGISHKNKEELFKLFSKLSSEYLLDQNNTKLFATGVFRDIQNIQDFIEEFYIQTGLYFNVVSHELEAFFLEKALIRSCPNNLDILVINIGGKTTELLFYNDSKLVDKKMLDYGVGTILKKYPTINDKFSQVDLNMTVSEVHSVLTKTKINPKLAFYTGGELTYMKIAGYNLKKNELISDENHPYQISFEDFSYQNHRIFNEISIDQLRGLMPNNPDWMNGARACSAISQSICEFYNIKTIIPSDVNLINGVVVQEARTATICGSFNKNLEGITKLVDILEDNGINVLSPKNTEVVGSKNSFVLFKGDNLVNNCSMSVESMHLKAIENSDIVIVYNCEGYVGLKTSFEVGYAYKCGKKIVFLDDNEIVCDFDLPSEVGLLCYYELKN